MVIVAGEFKSELDRWRGTAAVAAVLGALLETLAASLAVYRESVALARTSVAIAGTVVLAIVPYVASTSVSRDEVKNGCALARPRRG